MFAERSCIGTGPVTVRHLVKNASNHMFPCVCLLNVLFTKIQSSPYFLVMVLLYSHILLNYTLNLVIFQICVYIYFSVTHVNA